MSSPEPHGRESIPPTPSLEWETNRKCLFSLRKHAVAVQKPDFGFIPLVEYQIMIPFPPASLWCALWRLRL